MRRHPRTLRLVGIGWALLGTAHCGDSDCDELQRQAGRAIHAAADRADRSCGADGDCALADYSVSCIDTCGSELTSIASAAVAALQAQSRDADTKYCGQFERQSCTLIAPACDPPQVPVASCQQGQCVLTFVSR
jgi:hypothetical protein